MDLHALGTGAALSEAIVDTFGAYPPQLNLLDAVVAMEGPGPTRGRPRKLGYLAASTDAVALDAVVQWLCGFGPQEILTTRAAAAAGYGCDNLAEIVLTGTDPKLLRTKLQRAPSLPLYLPRWLGEWGRRLIYVRPRVDPRRCVACGQCQAVCPAECIEIEEYARIDRGKCLECFCCMEACPHDAVSVQRSLLSRFL